VEELFKFPTAGSPGSEKRRREGGREGRTDLFDGGGRRSWPGIRDEGIAFGLTVGVAIDFDPTQPAVGRKEDV